MAASINRVQVPRIFENSGRQNFPLFPSSWHMLVTVEKLLSFACELSALDCAKSRETVGPFA